MLAIIIAAVFFVAVILWIRWEIKHAEVMPEDLDEETQKLINDRNNHDNFNNPAL
jgi:hypothetical protein